MSRRVLCINVWGRDNEEPCQHMVTWVRSHIHIFPSLPFPMRLPPFCASSPLAAPATLCMIDIIAVDDRCSPLLCTRHSGLHSHNNYCFVLGLVQF